MSATIEPEIAVPKGRLLPSAGSSSPKVMRAIMGVMKRVKEVRKEGWNSEGKYGFVMANDARALLQDAMIEEDLHISQREVRWEIVNKVLTVYYEFDARHVESGETIYNIASSTGACRFEFKSGTTDDKSFSKSKTSSEKYTLLSLFMIPSDDYNVERASDGDADAQGLRDAEPITSDGRRVRQPGSGEERSTRRPPDDGPPADYAPPPDDRQPSGAPPGEPSRTNGRVNGEAPGFREEVMLFKRKLDGARSEDDAAELWRDDGELLRQMSDSTYDFIRSGYFSRWGIYPPATP